MMGLQYAAVTLNRFSDNSLNLQYSQCSDAMGGQPESVLTTIPLPSGTTTIRIRCTMQSGGLCTFSWQSSDDNKWTAFEGDFQAVEGRWIGARIGLFVENKKSIGEQGWIDFDYFRIE